MTVPYALSQAFVMPQSARKPMTPTATYRRSSMDVLLEFGRIDEDDEVAGVLEGAPQAFRARRQPAVMTAEHDKGVGFEGAWNRLHLVAAQIHANACADALAGQPLRERMRLEGRQPIGMIDLDRPRHR